MAKKIYISGNALRVDDTVSLNVDLDVLKKNVYYNFTSLTNDRVNFIYKRLDGSYGNYIHPLSDCVDKDLNSFTESDFRIFCNRNLGFDLAPAGATLNGFIDYNDTSTASGIALVKNVWTDIPNNGLGPSTNKASKPAHVTELMDTTTGYLDYSELNVGDGTFIRNDHTIVPQSNNASLEVRYELGFGQAKYLLEKTMPRLDLGSGIPYRYSLQTDYIYVGDDNTRLNPIRIQVKLSVDGTLFNAGSVIQVVAR